jgi:hypothetical protein
MGKTVYCPEAATMTSVVTALNSCPNEFAQIQKLVFWERGAHLDAVASAISATVWTAHLAATGDAKALVSPMLTLTIPASEAREAGSGNEVIDGIPISIGGSPVKAEGKIWELDQATITLLKAIAGKALDVMFINEAGQLGYKLDGVKVAGFPIKSLFISDLQTGSFADGTLNNIHFYMAANWSDNFRVTTATSFLLDSVNS